MSSVWHKLQQVEKKKKLRETHKLYGEKYRQLRTNQILSDAIYSLRHKNEGLGRELETKIQYYNLLCDRCKKRIRYQQLYDNKHKELLEEQEVENLKIKRLNSRIRELQMRGKTKWGKEASEVAILEYKKVLDGSWRIRSRLEEAQESLEKLEKEFSTVEQFLQSPRDVDKVFGEFMDVDNEGENLHLP